MRVVIIVAFLISQSGCIHHQLRRSTVNQARTVADVHTQQVLDNVAKFVANPHALPHFSYPNQGATSVSDSGAGSAGFVFTPFRIDDWNWGVNASRSIDEAYTMTPINDPEKLTLMRCAYQRAVGSCTCNGESATCPNCQRNFNRFYLGDEDISKTGEVTVDGKAVYRVKGSVALVFFEFGSSEATEIVPMGVGPVHHFVAAGRNNENKVVYEYLRTEGAASPLPELGKPLFKLYQAEIRTFAEFDELRAKACNNKGMLRFLLGLGYRDQLIAAGIDPGAVLGPNKGTGPMLQQNCEPDPYFDPTLLQQYKSSLYYNIPNDIRDDGAEEEKAKYRVKVLYPKALTASEDLEQVYVDSTVAEQTKRSGRVTSACLYENCWFKAGRKCDVPRDCCTTYVGRYCDTYVWVPPCGRDQLTKLTLTILDIASSEPASNPTTEVYAFIDENGTSATTYERAAYFAKATLPRGGSVSAVIPSMPSNAEPPNEDEIKVLKQSRDELRLRFKRALSIAEIDVYDAINELRSEGNGSFPSSVEFVSQDYLMKSLDFQNGDALIALAAGVLSNKGPSLLKKHGGDTDDEVSEITATARDFLNSEDRLQDLSGMAPGPQRDGAVPPIRRSRRPSSVGANVLRSLQDLESLGGMR